MIKDVYKEVPSNMIEVIINTMQKSTIKEDIYIYTKKYVKQYD